MSQSSDTQRKVRHIASPALFLMVMALGYAVYAADRTVLASVLVPMQSSLNLSNPQLALLGSAQYIGVTCFVFIAGHLSDRYGRWKIVLSGVALFSSFTWLIGLSRDFSEAFVFRLISGFGEGIFWPVAMASVAKYFGQRKGLALGIFYVGFDTGSVLGLSVGGIVYSFSNNWRPAFFVAPLFGVLAILGIFLLKRNFTDDFESKKSEVPRIRLGRDALQLLKERNIALLMLFALLATWASVWQVVFLPYYFFKVMHFGVLSSALLSAMVLGSGAFGKITLGGVSDFFKRNRLLPVISLLVLVFYGIFFSAFNFFVDLGSAVAMGFFSASIFPITQSLVADSCEGKTGTALGLTTTTQSVATVFSTLIAGLLFSIGVGRAIALDAMIPTALALAVAIFLKEPRKLVSKEL